MNPADRLHPDRLASVPQAFSKPAYDRQATPVGIVHLGVGAFHRGHLAWYTEAVLNASGGDWGILGVSLRSDRVQQQLRPQAGLYTLVQREGDVTRRQIIGCIQDVLYAPGETEAILQAIAANETRVISLTITEKGYCLDATGTGVDRQHPDIRHDIKQLADHRQAPQPRSAIGLLVAGLARRRSQAGPGVTLLSCDNLSHNGERLRQALLDFARQVDPGLCDWITMNTACPNSVVDRMVPATAQEDLAALALDLGCQDQAAVFTEVFSQWIIEDHFINGRPAWEVAGVRLVESITPFEQAKLRLLNGSHSLLAYLGQLLGYTYVHQAMADPMIQDLVQRYMDEAASTLQMPAGFSLDDYRQQLMQRFANPSLNHRTAQIAEDGSQKIPQRWLETVVDASNKTLHCHALALASWVRFLGGRRDDGEACKLIDPMADSLVMAVQQSTGPAIKDVLQSIGQAQRLRHNPAFVAAAEDYLVQLQSAGSRATVIGYLSAFT